MPQSQHNRAAEPYLVIEDLRMSYGDTVAVDGVNLAIDRGQTLCLLGPSGCGKTTILRIVAGLLEPDSGAVRIDGQDLLSVPIHKRDIGLVFQTWALFPHMTVADNVGYGLRMRHVPAGERAERVAETLDLVRLGHLADRRPAQLSGGQQQRVALARALVTRPRLLLLDEPLSSLDLKIRSELRGELRRIQQALGVTAVYVTHDHSEALALGDQVSVMSVGHVIESGPPELLFGSPRTRYVTDFLGFDNILAAQELDRTDRTARMRLPDGAEVVVALVGPGDRDVTHDAVGVSPWAVTPGVGDGTLHGQVVSLDHQAGRLLVGVSVPAFGATLTGFAAAENLPQLGQDVPLSVDWAQARALEA